MAYDSDDNTWEGSWTNTLEAVRGQLAVTIHVIWSNIWTVQLFIQSRDILADETQEIANFENMAKDDGGTVNCFAHTLYMTTIRIANTSSYKHSPCAVQCNYLLCFCTCGQTPQCLELLQLLCSHWASRDFQWAFQCHPAHTVSQDEAALCMSDEQSHTGTTKTCCDKVHEMKSKRRKPMLYHENTERDAGMLHTLLLVFFFQTNWVQPWLTGDAKKFSLDSI